VRLNEKQKNLSEAEPEPGTENIVHAFRRQLDVLSGEITIFTHGWNPDWLWPDPDPSCLNAVQYLGQLGHAESDNHKMNVLKMRIGSSNSAAETSAAL
jgi:hypothetical protein